MKYLRSAAALILGPLCITFLVEAVEFLLVGLLNGGFTTDPARYLAIRNRTPFLVSKVVYNFLGGWVGGWIAAKLAGWRPGLHGVGLIAVQGSAFTWAILSPELSATAPLWGWLAFGLSTCAGIAVGSGILARD